MSTQRKPLKPLRSALPQWRDCAYLLREGKRLDEGPVDTIGNKLDWRTRIGAHFFPAETLSECPLL
jgi:hypothetical protein